MSAVCVTRIEFGPLQWTGKVGDKVSDTKVGDMICVATFMIFVHDWKFR